MKQRPLAVTLIGVLYILTGVGGLVSHALLVKSLHPFPYDVLWPELLGLVAAVSGVYLLRGADWARWLALAWIASHVVISVFHSWFQLAVHIVMCTLLAYFLCRPRAARYFRRTTGGAASG
jgi:hypothetical protein